MSKQSEILTAFYRAYLEVATTEKASSYLLAETGLCHSLSSFMISVMRADKYWEARNEMQSQFIEAGLNHLFPFNFDAQDYHEEMQRGGAFRNPKRMAWVREHAK